LKKVFNLYTREKAGRGRRLLIINNHSSHVNIAFIKEYNKRKIYFIILLLYST
ncbi:hypothetical protein DL98DRAFT_436220, partial [Cadophora sp. DSE1049]